MKVLEHGNVLRSNILWYFLITCECPRCHCKFTLDSSDFSLPPAGTAAIPWQLAPYIGYDYNALGGIRLEAIYVSGPCPECHFFMQVDRPTPTSIYDDPILWANDDDRNIAWYWAQVRGIVYVTFKQTPDHIVAIGLDSNGTPLVNYDATIPDHIWNCWHDHTINAIYTGVPLLNPNVPTTPVAADYVQLHEYELYRYITERLGLALYESVGAP